MCELETLEKRGSFIYVTITNNCKFVGAVSETSKINTE